LYKRLQTSPNLRRESIKNNPLADFCFLHTMRLQIWGQTPTIALHPLEFFAHGASASRALNNDGLSTCTDDSSNTIDFKAFKFEYHGDDRTFDIDIKGTSESTQNISVVVSAAAYGNDRYSEDLHPCDPSTFIQNFCGSR
jgi:hypothetical protein